MQDEGYQGEGKNAPGMVVELDKHGKPDYGKLIKCMRILKAWKRKDLAALYGYFFRDEQISEDTIRMWEDYNKVPKSQKRRYVLARLLDIPVIVFGLPPLEEAITLEPSNTVKKGSIDIVGARLQLQTYREQNHATTAADALEDIMECIYDIHDRLPYVRREAEKQLTFLLCDYHQFVASILRDRNCYEEAVGHLNKAYRLAKKLESSQKQDKVLLSLVLFRRGLIFHYQGDLSSAISDFQVARGLDQHISLQLRGATLMAAGHVQAHAALDADEMREALKLIDESQVLLEPGQNEPDTFFIKFNEEGYHINRASALLGSPNRKLHDTNQALNEIARVATSPSRKRRYAYSTILQARAWFDEGEYALATQLAKDALVAVNEIQSWVNFAHIETLYGKLKETPYKNSTALAELGVDLLKARHPQHF